jgi:hypothetical protein
MRRRVMLRFSALVVSLLLLAAPAFAAPKAKSPAVSQIGQTLSRVWSGLVERLGF